MDIPERTRRPNPIDRANFFSKHFLIWFWPIFRLGYKRSLTKQTDIEKSYKKEPTSLTKDDLWDPPKDDKATDNTDSLELYWQELNKQRAEKANPKNAKQSKGEPENVQLVQNGHTNAAPGDGTGLPAAGISDQSGMLLLHALIATFGLKYFLVWPLIIFNDCFLRVIQPWFMLCLIRTFVEEPVDHTAQYIYAAGICLSTGLLTLTNNPCLFYMGRLGQRCRIALTSLIQRKMTRIGTGGQLTTTGEITNLISNDASYIENNIQVLPYLLVAPLQLAIFMVFIWDEFGISSLAGVGFILLYMPFQYWNGTKSSQYRQEIGKKTDARVSALSEVIDGINSVKMYAWETVFQFIVQKKRKAEVKQLQRRSALHAFQMSIFLTSSRIVPFLTFLAFILAGGPLTADRVFYAVAVYNTVTHYMVFMLPGAIRGIGEINGSLKRIQAFLMLKERPGNEGRYEKYVGQRSVSIQHVSAAWTETSDCVLQNISLDVTCKSSKCGKLILVVGPVGSGKSSFLHLPLNELYLKTGKVSIGGGVSYASQDGYVFPGSIRKNILFHNRYDEERYRRVLEATGLDQDILLFNKRDRAIATGLSGGQKARVNLARSMYHQADIYLLDDPLSAVDTRVSRQIWDKCLKGFLQDKLKIVVTHQLQYCDEADEVIVLNQGSIEAMGTYEEVKTTIEHRLGKATADKDVDSILTTGPVSPTNLHTRRKKDGAVVSVVDDDDEDEEDEGKGQGALGLKIYWRYFKSGNSKCQLWTYFLIFIVAQVFTTLIEYWLALWTNKEERLYEESHHHSPSTNTEIDNQNSTSTSIDNETISFDTFVTMLNNIDDLEQHMYLHVYTVLTVIVFLTNLAKAVAFFHYCMRICSNVHKRMLQTLLRAQPSFFNENPSGRIMNRFTKDMGIIDEMIPFCFFDMFTIFLQIATVIFLIVLAIWYSFVAVIFFLLALWYVRKYYVTTSRDLKRIEGTTRSPIITHLQSSFQGLVTVRALNAEATMKNQFDSLQDEYTSATISFLAASQCFNIWIELLATVLLTLVAFGFLVAQNYFGVTFVGGNVGLAICSAMSLTIWLQYGMKVSANVENAMISVERALEYTKLEPEASLESSPENVPSKNWPQDGKLEFRNVYLAYNEREDSLKDLSFVVEAGEKIGIVGRTGAGKSSILWALFRMTELKTGNIFMDLVDVGKLGLNDLRKNLAIIPQMPQLFKGSLEFNLDPRLELAQNGNRCCASRKEMQQILSLVGLDKSLDFEVLDKGSNLAFGERQKVSLCRALLLKRKIVCMDEATAHIDTASDEKIQKIFRETFVHSSVITVAHRLGTVIECDKILVLDEGQLQEFGHPHQLLQNEESNFKEMVEAAGKDADTLKQRAAEAWNKRSSKV